MRSFMAVLVVLCVTTAALAVPVTVVNGGFESPAWNGGGGAQDPAWVDAGSGGAGIEFGTYASGWTPFSLWGHVGSRIVYSTPAAWDWNYYPGVNQTPYGSQVATPWLGCGYEQTLTTLQANTTYTLSYDVGIGKDRPSNDAAWFRVEMKVDDGVWGSQLLSVGKGLGAGEIVGAEYGQVASAYNNWVHQTVSFTTGSNPSFLGNNVKVLFFGDGSVRLDNFTLDATVVPEPATLMLLGIGGLLLRRRC